MGSSQIKEVILKLAREKYEEYRPVLFHILGEKAELMSFNAVEEFFSSGGQTKWHRDHLEGVANINTGAHYFLRYIREMVWVFGLDEKLTIQQLFDKAEEDLPEEIKYH